MEFRIINIGNFISLLYNYSEMAILHTIAVVQYYVLLRTFFGVIGAVLEIVSLSTSYNLTTDPRQKRLQYSISESV